MGFKGWVAMLCAAAVLSGCASFRNNEIADAGALPDVSGYQNKPSVFVETHFFRGEPGAPVTEILVNRDKIHELVGKSLGDSGMFSRHSFDEADKAGADYTLRLDIYNHGNTGLAMAAGFISGFTFGVIPAAATDNYTLEAKLADTSGTVVSKATNKDSITTWIGLVFIPAMAATPEKALTGTLDNQLKTVLKELVEGGKLKYSDVMRRRAAPVFAGA
ncbi:hypothetical protein GRF61_16535 [Azoarcus sp. TTM-91]|uniref:hypothetical protein n=1 Tax=Azoarcus sp. TTM-91 TaxID=2691581 RepID=UPI00145F7931|nr:hypothetical protein [Azoarcus sp. TTM-91]NMG36056.1 hypothetical protein [Azoarcus sp. TTM-91]